MSLKLKFCNKYYLSGNPCSGYFGSLFLHNSTKSSHPFINNILTSFLSKIRHKLFKYWQRFLSLMCIIRGPKASKYKTTAVYCKTPEFEPPNSFKEEDKNDRIVSYKTRSCSILPSFLSWIPTALIKLIPFLDQVEHWWVTIETQNGKIYNLQHIVLAQVHSRQNTLESKRRQSDQNALSLCYLRNQNARIWDQKRYCKENVNKTINDVIEWLKTDDMPAQYKLLTNNCQDICRKFSRAI